MDNAHPPGTTRSRVAPNYALITPDTRVSSPLVGWRHASAVIHISPELGARFLQYTAALEADAKSGPAGDGVERVLFVLAGEPFLELDGHQYQLRPGSFAYLPPDAAHSITTSARQSAPAILAIFEKYRQGGGFAPPKARVGHESEIEGAPFQGDEDLRLQVLLPVEPEFDLAVNVFTFQPGGALPQVEIHVMEHGLLMLDGRGVYRLGDDYHQVQAGDVIWMASFCPQWFTAFGKSPARYLYYKDIHRDRMTDKSAPAPSLA